MASTMHETPNTNLWSLPEHVLDYLRRADAIPHRVEGEAALLELLPATAERILDLGSGAGRLVTLAKTKVPSARFVALDFSQTMLSELARAFGEDPLVVILAHDLDDPLPRGEPFDAVVSSFAIHHLVHERKRALYEEVFESIAPGGIFCNLEHVASPTSRVHNQFLEAIGWPDEDPSNKLLDLETQLQWLRNIGFADVDCFWKWRELALFCGVKPS